MIRSKNFVFYNVNPRQKYHKDGSPAKWKTPDCVIRAISKTENISWLEAFDLLIKTARDNFMMPNQDDLLDILLPQLGYEKHTFSSTSRAIMEYFVHRHPQGTYIARTPKHITAVVDGKFYDTWDCSRRYVSSYWEKLNK